MRRRSRDRWDFSDSRLSIWHPDSLGRPVGSGGKTLPPCGHVARIAIRRMAAQSHILTAPGGMSDDRSRRTQTQGWFFGSHGFPLPTAHVLHGNVPCSPCGDTALFCAISAVERIEPLDWASPNDRQSAPNSLAPPESRSRLACSRAEPRDP